MVLLNSTTILEKQVDLREELRETTKGFMEGCFDDHLLGRIGQVGNTFLVDHLDDTQYLSFIDHQRVGEHGHFCIDIDHRVEQMILVATCGPSLSRSGEYVTHQSESHVVLNDFRVLIESEQFLQNGIGYKDLF
jgi:hypothetical protein